MTETILNINNNPSIILSIEDIDNFNSTSNLIEENLNIEEDFVLFDNITNKKISVYSNDYIISKYTDYQTNYRVKDLILICEYYEFKNIKKNNKEQLIKLLLEFEIHPDNLEIVFKRKKLWYYINSLKSDKYMKKFISF